MKLRLELKRVFHSISYVYLPLHHNLVQHVTFTLVCYVCTAVATCKSGFVLFDFILLFVSKAVMNWFNCLYQKKCLKALRKAV